MIQRERGREHHKLVMLALVKVQCNTTQCTVATHAKGRIFQLCVPRTRKEFNVHVSSYQSHSSLPARH